MIPGICIFLSRIWLLIFHKNGGDLVIIPVVLPLILPYIFIDHLLDRIIQLPGSLDSVDPDTLLYGD